MDLLEIKTTCFSLSLAIIRFHLNSYAVRVLYNYTIIAITV